MLHVGASHLEHTPMNIRQSPSRAERRVVSLSGGTDAGRHGWCACLLRIFLISQSSGFVSRDRQRGSSLLTKNVRVSRLSFLLLPPILNTSTAPLWPRV